MRLKARKLGTARLRLLLSPRSTEVKVPYIEAVNPNSLLCFSAVNAAAPATSSDATIEVPAAATGLVSGQLFVVIWLSLSKNYTNIHKLS